MNTSLSPLETLEQRARAWRMLADAEAVRVRTLEHLVKVMERVQSSTQLRAADRELLSVLCANAVLLSREAEDLCEQHRLSAAAATSATPTAGQTTPPISTTPLSSPRDVTVVVGNEDGLSLYGDVVHPLLFRTASGSPSTPPLIWSE
eukprot:3936419-Rhodomonas_salina.2